MNLEGIQVHGRGRNLASIGDPARTNEVPGRIRRYKSGTINEAARHFAELSFSLQKSGRGRAHDWTRIESGVRPAGTVAGVPTSAYSVAGVYAALGDQDKAFEMLNKAYDEHDMQLVSLKVDPSLDGLRDDSRFFDLVRRVGLPE